MSSQNNGSSAYALLQRARTVLTPLIKIWDQNPRIYEGAPDLAKIKELYNDMQVELDKISSEPIHVNGVTGRIFPLHKIEPRMPACQA